MESFEIARKKTRLVDNAYEKSKSYRGEFQKARPFDRYLETKEETIFIRKTETPSIPQETTANSPSNRIKP